MEGAAPGGNDNYEAEFTWTAFFCCLTAASGGALFGYDNGALASQRNASYTTVLLSDCAKLASFPLVAQ